MDKSRTVLTSLSLQMLPETDFIDGLTVSTRLAAYARFSLGLSSSLTARLIVSSASQVAIILIIALDSIAWAPSAFTVDRYTLIFWFWN
jgi:hypothetical protein